MAIEDYIPNFFGGGMPSYLPGLLGEQETAALQKRANVQGLLGAAITLAGGMAPYGPRRTAAQNVLGALAGGFQAGQGAYQGATQNIMMQQQIADAALKRQQAQMKIQTIIELQKTNPDLARLIAIDETAGAKVYGEQIANAPIAALYRQYMPGGQPVAATATQMPDQEPQGVTTGAIPMDGMPTQEGLPSQEDPILPTVPVFGKNMAKLPEIIDLENKIAYLTKVSEGAVSLPNGDKVIERNDKLIAQYRKKIGKVVAENLDLDAFKQNLAEPLKPFVDTTAMAILDGQMDIKDATTFLWNLQKESADIGKTGQIGGIAGDYAQFQFGTKDPKKLTREQYANVLNYANAPTATERANTQIAADRLKFETGSAPGVPTSREQMIGSGGIPQISTQIAATAQPSAGATTPAATQKALPSIPGTQQQQQKQKYFVEIDPTVVPLVRQPDAKVPQKRKQELVASQPSTENLTRYTLRNVIDSRDAAQKLLSNPNYIKAISGVTAPALARVPGTDAYTANQLLNNLLGRSFVNEIQQMRSASPTGGAVGNVAVAEMEALSKIQAAMSLGMKEQELRKQIQQYINVANRSIKTIPREYSRVYGYSGEFEDLFGTSVVPQDEKSKVDSILEKYK